jgi:hypothetical protein
MIRTLTQKRMKSYTSVTYGRLAGSDEADPSEAHSWQQMTKGLDNGKYRSLQERIVKNQKKEARKKKISCWTNTYQMAEEHRVWWKEDWIVVAGDNDLKRGVIHYFHDTPSAGHPGITNTYELAKHDIWWPYMKQDVEQYVKGCAVCQANKVNTRPLKPGMAPITPEHSLPFQTVAMDFITKLPKSGKREYNTILTITDHVTDLQGPPSERTQTEKLRDLKTLAQRYARDQGSCDDVRISYLEFLESEAEDNLTLAWMISG